MPGAGQLVPFGNKRAMTRVVLANKKARLAYGIAQHIYQNRGRYRRAAIRIGRAYRRYKRRKTVGRIGESVRSPTRSKTHLSASNVATRDTRVLYNTELTALVATGSGINARERQQVYFGGVKFCISCRNNATVPLLVNYAIVHDKQTNNALTSVNPNDFFRTQGSTSRNTDFNNALSSLEFHCNHLNTDRFTVLHHRRIMLGPSPISTGYTPNVRTNFRQIRKYVPIKRKIAFEDNLAQSKIWFIMWCDRQFTTGGSSSVAGAIEWQERHWSYFREMNP